MIQISGPLTSNIDRNSELYQRLNVANARLAQKDATLWGKDAEAEASIRLNWVDLPHSSRDLLPTLDALAAKFRGRKVALCGMGGSSLAPEVIAKSYKHELFVFDSTDPNYAAHLLKLDLSNYVIIDSSKSGSTIETHAQRLAVENALLAQGLDPKNHFVVVTDPGSPLDKEARGQGLIVVNADANVGGRFSALTAFGLVPTALMGADPSVLLDSAASQHSELLKDNNVAVDIAYLMSTASNQFVAFADSHDLPGLSDWIEQLVAESTGKDQKGRLPVVIGSIDEAIGSEQMKISFDDGGDLNVIGDLGEHFITWEWATALLGVALEIDPFNQPNVTEAKNATISLLKEWNNKLPDLTQKNSSGSLEFDGDSITAELSELIENSSYIAILSYLDRRDDVAVTELRKILAEKSGKPVTFGWGPRFQHSTGQFHKAGQPNGAFLILTGAIKENFEVRELGFSFGTLVMAQALGEYRALGARKYPVRRVHLRDRASGISELLAAAKKL